MSTTTTKPYELTDADRAQFPAWRAKWIGHAMSVQAMTEEEREIARKAVDAMYALVNLTPPIKVFVSSPFVLAVAGGFAAAMLYLKEHPEAGSDENTANAKAAVFNFEKLKLSATEGVGAEIVRATMEAIGEVPQLTVVPSTATTDDSKWYTTVPVDVVRNLSKQIGASDFLLKCVASVGQGNMWNGGNQWSGWVSYLSFFKDVAKLDLPQYAAYAHYEALAIHSGPRVLHPKFCMLSDRPEKLVVDDQNRPHCDDGPFCRWRDGSSLYAVHGTRVPAWLVENPERLTVAIIEAETNAEVRRVMVTRYGQGIYLSDSGAVEIHRDDCGVLYRKDQPGDEALMMVNVLNSTPEPDGPLSKSDALAQFSPNAPVCHDGMMIKLSQAPETFRFKSYFIRVKPDCVRAKQAVAWTFGEAEEDYNPTFQS